MFPNFVGAVFFFNGILTGKACNIHETLPFHAWSAKSSLQRMCHLSIRLTNGVADVAMDVLGEFLAVKSTYSLTMPGSWHLP